MGDRAIIQFIDSKGEYSPAIYMHNEGSEAFDLIVKTAMLMNPYRNDDVDYSAARFTGLAHEHIGGFLSLGISNIGHVVSAADSHGDNGVFLIHCYGDWEVHRFHCELTYESAGPSMRVFARVCDVTGRGFDQGWCWHDGAFYTCDEKTTLAELKREAKALALPLVNADGTLKSDDEILESAYNLDICYWSDWSEDEEHYIL